MIKLYLGLTIEIILLSFRTHVKPEIKTRESENMAWNNSLSLLLKVRAGANATSWYILQKKSTRRQKEFNLMGHLSLSRVSDAHLSGM